MLLRVVHMEFHYSFNALAEHVEREAFVWRVDGVRFQTEAHQYGLDAEDAFKVADDWNTTSTTNRQWLLAECLGETLFSSLVSRESDRAYITFTTVHRSYLHLYIFRSDFVDVVDEQL